MKIKHLLPRLLLVMSSLTIISGCNNEEKSNETELIFGSYISSELIEIETYGDFKSKLAIKNKDTNEVEGDKENFMIVIYRKGCSCWSTFEHTVLIPFNELHHTIIYKMNAELFLKDYDTFGLDIRSDRETFAIFNNGELKTQQVYSESNKMFKDIDVFTNYIEAKTNYPKAFHINKAQLDEKYMSTTPFIIEFGRATCPDCNYVNKNSIKSYYINNKDNKEIYLFDVDEIRLNSQGEVNQEAWTEFKDNYGLSDVYNKKTGYSTGFVPTFHYIVPNGTGEKINTIETSSVYVNDLISEVNNKFIITESFYSQSRLVYLDYAKNVPNNVLEGKELSSEELDIYREIDYISWKYEYASKMHDPLLYAFFDKYTK